MKEPNSGLDRLELDKVVFIGRTLSEYVKFFDLDLSSWRGCKILDCPAGAASFTAETKKHGIHAVGCDPLFDADLKVLIERGEADIENVIKSLLLVLHLLNWNFYRNIDVYKECRKQALQQFAEDYLIGIVEKRYIKAKLPNLPFDDRSFDLVLCGHFLFMPAYGDKLDYLFHIDSILELFRVSSKEVRIYPIPGSDDQSFEYVENALSDLKRKGITAEIVPISSEFLRGSNQVLRLIR